MTDNNRADDKKILNISSTERRAFLQGGALLLGTSLLARPGLSFAQLPANAAELDAQLFPGFEPMSLETNGVTIMARRSRIYRGRKWQSIWPGIIPWC
jgi:hypothetical protein